MADRLDKESIKQGSSESVHGLGLGLSLEELQRFIGQARGVNTFLMHSRCCALEKVKKLLRR